MNFLTITQIAKLLGKSRQWVWFLIRSNQLKAEKVGNQFVIKSEDLQEIINNTINQQKSVEVNQ